MQRSSIEFGVFSGVIYRKLYLRDTPSGGGAEQSLVWTITMNADESKGFTVLFTINRNTEKSRKKNLVLFSSNTIFSFKKSRPELLYK